MDFGATRLEIEQNVNNGADNAIFRMEKIHYFFLPSSRIGIL
jgi:hypothetical protein